MENSLHITADDLRDDDTDWLGSDPAAVVSKRGLARALGLTQKIVDRCIADGAPVLARGAKHTGYQISVPEFVQWYATSKIAEARGSDAESRFQSARVKRLESRNAVKSQRLDEDWGRLVSFDTVMREAPAVLECYVPIVRELPDASSTLTDEQRADLRAMIEQAITEMRSRFEQEFSNG